MDYEVIERLEYLFKESLKLQDFKGKISIEYNYGTVTVIDDSNKIDYKEEIQNLEEENERLESELEDVEYELEEAQDEVRRYKRKLNEISNIADDY